MADDMKESLVAYQQIVSELPDLPDDVPTLKEIIWQIAEQNPALKRFLEFQLPIPEPREILTDDSGPCYFAPPQTIVLAERFRGMGCDHPAYPKLETWNHRVMSHLDKDGNGYIGIHEVYFDTATGEILAWTEDAEVTAGDIEDLRWTLENMIKCLDRPMIDAK